LRRAKFPFHYSELQLQTLNRVVRGLIGCRAMDPLRQNVAVVTQVHLVSEYLDLPAQNRDLLALIGELLALIHELLALIRELPLELHDSRTLPIVLLREL
jgi:hypothetical protein